MKKIVGHLIAAVSAAVILGSCTSTPDIPVSIEKEETPVSPSGKLDASENYIRYMIFLTMMDVHKDNVGAATEASLDVLNRVFGVKIDFK